MEGRDPPVVLPSVVNEADASSAAAEAILLLLLLLLQCSIHVLLLQQQGNLSMSQQPWCHEDGAIDLLS